MSYVCNWSGCPASFCNNALRREHLHAQHWTPEGLELVRVVDGNWEAWLKTHGKAGGTQSTSDQWMPSQVLQPSTPDADEHSSPNVPDPFSRRRSVSRFTFSSLDRPSDSPSDTPPPDRQFDPSPSPGTLATRKQSHIPVLPPTPTPRIPAVFAGLVRARSVESSGSAPARKKRRVDVSDDESETERPEAVDYEIGLSAALAAGGSARSRSHSSSASSASSRAVELQLTQNQSDLSTHTSVDNSPGLQDPAQDQGATYDETTQPSLPQDEPTHKRIPRRGRSRAHTPDSPTTAQLSPPPVLRRSSRARSTTPSVQPPSKPKRQRSVQPDSGIDAESSTSKSTETSKKPVSRRSSSRTSATSARDRVKAKPKNGDRSLRKVVEVEEDEADEESEMVEKSASPKDAPSQEVAVPVKRFRSGRLVAGTSPGLPLDSHPNSQPPQSPTRAETKVPPPSPQRPSYSQVPLLTQKPYNWSQSDSGPSDESQSLTQNQTQDSIII